MADTRKRFGNPARQAAVVAEERERSRRSEEFEVIAARERRGSGCGNVRCGCGDACCS